MRDSAGGPYQRSGGGVGGLGAHDHPRVPREDQIEFVRVRMGVDGLSLSGLETIEADEELRPARDLELGEFAWRKASRVRRLKEILGHECSFVDG